MTRSQHRPTSRPRSPKITIERIQTGVRIEKSILKVLKALAAYHDMSLGDLLEGIVLHAFEGKPAFGAIGLARIDELKRIYGMRFDASHSHRLIERGDAAVRPTAVAAGVKKKGGGRRRVPAARRT
jgi:hypothetical protein